MLFIFSHKHIYVFLFLFFSHREESAMVTLHGKQALAVFTAISITSQGARKALQEAAFSDTFAICTRNTCSGPAVTCHTCQGHLAHPLPSVLTAVFSDSDLLVSENPHPWVIHDQGLECRVLSGLNNKEWI